MGDSSSCDSSWKKMVIAKANNEWITSIKTGQSARNNTVNSTTFSLEYEQSPFDIIKTELEERSEDESYELDESTGLKRESDPLLSPRRKNETAGERAARLAKMSAYAAQRLANETPEQRALRLKRMSDYAAKRLATETREQRAKRLARMSAYAAKRLAKETPQQRQVRLARMSAYAARRHAMKKVTNPGSSERLHTNYNIKNIAPNQS